MTSGFTPDRSPTPYPRRTTTFVLRERLQFRNYICITYSIIRRLSIDGMNANVLAGEELLGQFLV